MACSVRQKNFRMGSNVYSRCEVVAMEWLVQEVLNFQCFLPTIFNFLWYIPFFVLFQPWFLQQTTLSVQPLYLPIRISSSSCTVPLLLTLIRNMSQVLPESFQSWCRGREEGQLLGSASSLGLWAARVLALNSCSCSCHLGFSRKQSRRNAPKSNRGMPMQVLFIWAELHNQQVLFICQCLFLGARVPPFIVFILLTHFSLLFWPIPDLGICDIIYKKTPHLVTLIARLCPHIKSFMKTHLVHLMFLQTHIRTEDHDLNDCIEVWKV